MTVVRPSDEYPKSRAIHLFRITIEAQFDHACMATQAAIDRLCAAEGFRGRVGMVEALRGPNYLREHFCSSLLSAWKEKDIILATGKPGNEWIRLLDAMPDDGERNVGRRAT